MGFMRHHGVCEGGSEDNSHEHGVSDSWIRRHAGGIRSRSEDEVMDTAAHHNDVGRTGPATRTRAGGR